MPSYVTLYNPTHYIFTYANQDALSTAYPKQNIEINLILRLTKYITTNLNVSIKAGLFLFIKSICYKLELTIKLHE